MPKTVFEAAAALAGFNRLLRALGLTLPEEVHQDASEIPESIKALAAARWQARLAKNWAESDTLRGQLAEQGWLVKDGRPGEPSTVKKVRRAWDVKK